MSNSVNINVIKDCLKRGSEFISDLALEIYGKGGERAFSEAIEIGITNTIIALYSANVPDEDIIKVMNECWGINKKEATDRLIYEKIQAPIRNLQEYMKLQGYSLKEINKFMNENRVSIMVRNQKELWQLKDKPERLLKIIEEKNKLKG